jgi:hypothetical protein
MAGLKRYNALLLFIFDIETPRHLLHVSMVELIKESADVAIIKVDIGRRPTIQTPILATSWLYSEQARQDLYTKSEIFSPSGIHQSTDFTVGYEQKGQVSSRGAPRNVGLAV